MHSPFLQISHSALMHGTKAGLKSIPLLIRLTIEFFLVHQCDSMYPGFGCILNGCHSKERVKLYSTNREPHHDRHRGRYSDLYVMDKGYNSEEIHELIRDTLTSCSLIPVRNRKRKRISGYYQRQIALSFDQEKYHQRNKLETVFSVLKRKFGESLKARKSRLQVKEIKIKVILYNLSKMISAFSMLFHFEVFFRAKKMLFLNTRYQSIIFSQSDIVTR